MGGTTERTGLAGALRRWPSWAAYAAAGWSLIYALVGFYWASGGQHGYGLPGSATLRPVGWGVAGVGLAGAVIALATVRPWGLGVSRQVLAAEAWALSGLAAAGTFGLVMRLIGLPLTGVVDDAAAQANQWLCAAGAVLFAATALSWQRRVPARGVQPVRSTGR